MAVSKGIKKRFAKFDTALGLLKQIRDNVRREKFM